MPTQQSGRLSDDESEPLLSSSATPGGFSSISPPVSHQRQPQLYSPQQQRPYRDDPYQHVDKVDHYQQQQQQLLLQAMSTVPPPQPSSPSPSRGRSRRGATSGPSSPPNGTSDTLVQQPQSATNGATPVFPLPGQIPGQIPAVVPPPAVPALRQADTDLSWGKPAGLPIRRTNDENLVIFRRAVGINSTLSGDTDSRSLEEGRRGAVGMYAAVLREQQHKKILYRLISILIYASHFGQIIIGASLTALGPTAGDHVILITTLGAINTIVAGVLALIKGQGLPDRFRHDQAEFGKLQDWIEQTEALLAVGVIGRDRKEVGLLVQVAFKKYNAARECEENNIPENYVRAAVGDADGTGRRTPTPDHDRARSPR